MSTIYMFPGIPGTTPSAPGFSAQDIANITDAMAAQGFVTAEQAGQIARDATQDAVLNLAQPVPYVPPAAWDPIFFDEMPIPNLPYSLYTAPFNINRRPRFLSSEGLSLGGGSSYQGGGFIDSIRSRFRPPAAPDVSGIQRDIEGLDVRINELQQQIDAVDATALRDMALDPLKTGIVENFDTFSISFFTDGNGIQDVIRRLDTSTQDNNSYINQIRDNVLRIAERTDKLREKDAEIARAVEGVAVIAGQGTPIETVRDEAERISTDIATQIAGDTLGNFLNGKIFQTGGDLWFDNQLGKRNFVQADDITGFADIRDIYVTGNQIDPVKIGSTKELILNKDKIIDGINSLPGILETAKQGLELPEAMPFSLDQLTNTQITDFMDRAKDLPPLDGIKTFFFEAVNANDNFFTPAHNSLYDQYTNLSDSLGTMREILFEREYTDFSYTVTMESSLPGTDPRSFGIPYKHTGLLAFANDAKADILSTHNEYEESGDKESVKYKSIMDALQKLTDYVTQAWSDALSEILQKFQLTNLSLDTLPNLTFLDEAIPTDWNFGFTNGLTNLAGGINNLPTKVPDGWET